jgi:hypothetical protein
MRLLDPGFRYVPATRTDIRATWQRFGFRPTTEAERRARQRSLETGAASAPPADIDLLPQRAPQIRPSAGR